MKKIFDFTIVDNLPALYHEKSDLVVIADLHLGLEGTMTFKGSYVPEFQLDEIKRDIKKIKTITNAGKILVNGDLKTEFRGSMYSEKKEIKDLLNLLEDLFEKVIIVKGNHDTFVEGIFEEHNITFADNFHTESRILYTHGHLELEDLEVKDKEYDTIVIGHEHPALGLKDDIGVKEKLDCFLYGDTEQNKSIVVLPAFSNISNGTSINESPQSQLLSPILRKRVQKDKLRAIGILRREKIFEFPELGKI